MDFGISIPDYMDNYLLLKTINTTIINIDDGIETLERTVGRIFSLPIRNKPMMQRKTNHSCIFFSFYSMNGINNNALFLFKTFLNRIPIIF